MPKRPSTGDAEKPNSYYSVQEAARKAEAHSLIKYRADEKAKLANKAYGSTNITSYVSSLAKTPHSAASPILIVEDSDPYGFSEESITYKPNITIHRG